MSCGAPASRKVNAKVGSMLIHVDNLFCARDRYAMPRDEKSVLLALAARSNEADGYRWAPGNGYLVNWTSLSESKVRECKATLAARSFISIEQRRAGKVCLPDLVTVHPDFGQWWTAEDYKKVDHSRNFTSKATPPGVPCEVGGSQHEGGGVPCEVGGVPCVPPLVRSTREVVCPARYPGSQGDELSLTSPMDLQNPQEREDVASLLLAPSTREDAPAPVTSPSPVASPVVVQEEVKETVQVGQQTTIPGVEAPKVVQKPKRAPRAPSVPATDMIPMPDVVVPGEATLKLCRDHQIDPIEAIEDMRAVAADKGWKSASWSGKFHTFIKNRIKWEAEDKKKNTGALPFGRGLSQTTKVDRRQPGDVKLVKRTATSDADDDSDLMVDFK